MSSEIRMAFAHPQERSEATTTVSPLDRISLRDHIVDVEIGAFQAERGITQRVCFNVVVEVRPLDDDVSDDVDRILSYDRVTEAIAIELAAERLNLLETLADRIAERILHEEQAMRVFVRVEKLDRGPGALGVEIVRAKKDIAARVDPVEDVVPHPCVVYLSNAAIASEHLTRWIDALAALSAPVILCVGSPDNLAPQAAHPMAQRRIELLAIEQNSWILAGRDPRCVVVDTRTELDWAMKNGQISVWAPSKIVLDAVEGPALQQNSALDLAGWFSAELGAKALFLIGEETPVTTSVAVRSLPIQSDLNMSGLL